MHLQPVRRTPYFKLHKYININKFRDDIDIRTLAMIGTKLSSMIVDQLKKFGAKKGMIMASQATQLDVLGT